MRPPPFTAADVRRWRRLTAAVRQVRRQLLADGLARPAALAEMRRAADLAGRTVIPARDERERGRMMAFWKLCCSYLIVNAEARPGLAAALLRGLDIAEAIIGRPDEPPIEPTPPPVAAARLPYRDA